jgi:lipoprotein NlpI
LQLSDFALAAQAFSRAIALDDSTQGIYYYRGVCLLSTEDYQEAVEDFSISIERKEMVHSSMFNRGISYLMLDEFERGLEDILAAADMDEDAEINTQANQLLDELKESS